MKVEKQQGNAIIPFRTKNFDFNNSPSFRNRFQFVNCRNQQYLSVFALKLIRCYDYLNIMQYSNIVKITSVYKHKKQKIYVKGLQCDINHTVHV